MPALFGHVRAAVCSSTTARKLLLGAQDPEIIEEDRTLDKGDIEMLEWMLHWSL